MLAPLLKRSLQTLIGRSNRYRTFYSFEDFELHLRADRLQDELAVTNDSVGMFFTIYFDGSFQQKIECILHAFFLGDYYPLRIRTIFKDLLPVFGTGGTIREFGIPQIL